MAIEFEVGPLSDFREFRRDLDEIDMEKVRHRASKRIAEEMFKMVQKAIRMEDDISSPSALNSKYDSEDGQDGPPISQRAAWKIEPTSKGSHSIRPVEEVSQRAYVLNYGYPGRITPNTADYLKFYIDGVPTYRKSVAGPDPTNYWEKAIEMLQKSGKASDIMEDELEKEFDKI